MRNAVLGAALITGAFFSDSLTAAHAKDWGQMNTDERLAYTESYIKQTCNHMKRSPPTTWQRTMIGVSPWGAVKSHLDSNCPAKTAAK